VTIMSTANDIREFLSSRRARITPEQAGLRAYGTRRRVSGLRREEVAMLAGISVEYYTQLERGSVRGVSDDVLDAVARALRLDHAERAHLFDLARAVSSVAPKRARPVKTHIRPVVQQILDRIDAPALVMTPTHDRSPR
jgi:transcriptional regulator with XRE-family HTH domain